jgi:hypothetical protein
LYSRVYNTTLFHLLPFESKLVNYKKEEIFNYNF